MGVNKCFGDASRGENLEFLVDADNVRMMLTAVSFPFDISQKIENQEINTRTD